MKSFVLAILLLSSLQVSAQERFDIVRVYAESVYDSAYISSLASKFLPVTRESYPEAIACLKSELMASGMFRKITTRLEARGPGIFQLVITPKWNGNPNNYVLKEIFLDESLEVRTRSRLMSRLEARGIKTGMPFTAYTALSRSIGDAVHELEDSGENISGTEIWVHPVLIKKDEIRLEISNSGPLCTSP